MSSALRPHLLELREDLGLDISGIMIQYRSRAQRRTVYLVLLNGFVIRKELMNRERNEPAEKRRYDSWAGSME